MPRRSSASSVRSSFSIAPASRATRSPRPAAKTLWPFAVASMCVSLPSRESPFRFTRYSFSRPVTIRVIVGGLTCSARARAPSVRGPPKTTTERAESRGAESPLASSSFRSCRSKWIAAEWSWSASNSASCALVTPPERRSSSRRRSPVHPRCRRSRSLAHPCGQ